MGIHNTALIGASSQGYQIQRSVRLRSSASAYFNRTPATTTNRRTWTVSFWIKRGRLFTGTEQAIFGSNNGGTFTELNYLASSDVLRLNLAAGVFSYYFDTTALFRDPSAWYHIVVAVDTTQATSTDRMKIYVNGVQQAGTNNPPTQNYDTQWNVAQAAFIGSRTASTWFTDCYLTEFNSIDGQALTPSSFGETNAVTGVWQPKKYAGTYGTNGFYLNFSDNSAATAAAIGKDYSGNGNNWTPNIISVTAGVTYDSMLDTPTPFADGGNGRGNYAVLNPLDKFTSLPAPTNGNLSQANGGAAWYNIRSTMGVASGKWYAEVTQSGSNLFAGVMSGSSARNFTSYTDASGLYAFFNNGGGTTGYKYANGTSGSSFTIADNDVIGLAYDYDAQTLAIYRNGNLQDTVTSIPKTETMFFCASFAQTTGSTVWNFGQRPFSYTPPTGFKALNTQNLPIPTITNGANHFAATTYTGTGSALSVSNAVNSKSFQPDWVWIKGRSVNYSHALFDVNRGVRNVLLSNSTNAETLETAGTSMTAFDSGGFSLGTNGGTASTNVNGSTFVAWQWKAGGTAVTNTNGTISSQVSANPTAGFSIVTYTANNTAGATIGHGLGVAPSFIIVKSRSAVNSWNSYHISLGNTKGFDLNSTSAASTSSNYWNNTSPTSSLFSVAAYTNNLTGTYVAYCFAPVAGYSAFGSYTGNGSTDGPFVFLGFRPRFVLFRSTSARNWVIRDTARDTFNTSTKDQYPDSAAVDGAGDAIDLLSNGFKLRATGATFNGSGEIYTYSAFAENPFKNSLAR